MHGGRPERASGGVSDAGGFPHRRREPPRSDHLARSDDPAGAARRFGAGVHRRVLERREPDPRALGPPRRRARHSRGAWRRHRRAASDAAGRESAALRRRRGARNPDRAADGRRAGAICRPLLGARAGPGRGLEPAVGRRHSGAGRRGPAGVRAAPAIGRVGERTGTVER